MHRIDAAGATGDHLFTNGDPASGTPCTLVDADWLNAVQENICQAIEAAGITLAKGDGTQLADAILALIVAHAPAPAQATTTAQGIVELATNAEAVTGTDTVRAVTPAGVTAAIAAHATTTTLEQFLMYS